MTVCKIVGVRLCKIVCKIVCQHFINRQIFSSPVDSITGIKSIFNKKSAYAAGSVKDVLGQVLIKTWFRKVPGACLKVS